MQQDHLGSRVLCNANSIPLVPELAEEYGIREALLLQQIHYWIMHKSRDPERYDKDKLGGYHWYYATFEDLSEKHPFLGHANHIRRMVKKLIEQGALIKMKPFAHNGDHTSWYRVNDSVISAVYERKLNERLKKQRHKTEQKKADINEMARLAVENAAKPPSNNSLEPKEEIHNKINEPLDLPNDTFIPINNLRGSYTKTTPETTAETSLKKKQAKANAPEGASSSFLPELDPDFDPPEKSPAPAAAPKPKKKSSVFSSEEFDLIFDELWKTGWVGSVDKPKAKARYRKLLERVAVSGQFEFLLGPSPANVLSAHSYIVEAAKSYHEYRRMKQEALDDGLDVFLAGIKACHRWLEGERWNNREQVPERAAREIAQAQQKMKRQTQKTERPWRPGDVDFEGLAYVADFIRDQGWDIPEHERPAETPDDLLALPDPDVIHADFEIIDETEGDFYEQEEG